jgi:hypothetical protein
LEKTRIGAIKLGQCNLSRQIGFGFLSSRQSLGLIDFQILLGGQ